MLPLASEAFTGEQLAVGPPFFNRVFAPIGALLLLLSSFGTVVAVAPRHRSRASPRVSRGRRRSRRSSRDRRARRVAPRRRSPASCGSSIAARRDERRRDRARASGRAAPATRSARNPRRYGGYVVHLGVAIMVDRLRREPRPDADRGHRDVRATRFAFAGYTFTYERLERVAAPDKDVNLAVLELRRGDRKRVTTLRPQLNFHRNWDQPQSEIAIRTTPTARRLRDPRWDRRRQRRSRLPDPRQPARHVGLGRARRSRCSGASLALLDPDRGTAPERRPLAGPRLARRAAAGGGLTEAVILALRDPSTWPPTWRSRSPRGARRAASRPRPGD